MYRKTRPIVLIEKKTEILTHTDKITHNQHLLIKKKYVIKKLIFQYSCKQEWQHS